MRIITEITPNFARMKILAIEKEMPGVADSDYKPWLETEARKAWELH